MLRIAILGSGALASYFAARLHNHAEVHLFGHWKARLNALKAEGLRFTSADAGEKNVPVKVSAIDDYQHYFDVVLVLVKSWQTPLAAQEAAQLISKEPRSFILTLQNGMGNVAILQTETRSKVVAGTTLQGAKVTGMNSVKDTGKGPVFLSDSVDSVFVDLLKKADFDVQLAPNLESMLWSKLLINAAINPVTAAFGVRNGILVEHEITRLLLGDLAKEVAELAKAKSISLLFDDPVKEAESVAKDTGANTSSMLADLRRGAPTELEAITGFVLHEAALMGLSLPKNKMVYHWMKAKLAGQIPNDSEYLNIAKTIAGAN